jgi:PAS domain S-box-containing protein
MNTADAGAPGFTSPGPPTDDVNRDMRHIVESGSVLLWVGAPDGTRRWVGPAFAHFTGRALAEVAGARWAEMIHPEDVERCTGIDLLCLALDRRYTLDYRLTRHDGRHVWMMDSATPCHDEDGRFKGHVGVCVDIDARYQIEEELAERMRRLRAMGRI